MLAGAQDGTVAGVIVWRLDRWTRNLRDLIDSIAALEAAGAAFVSVTESIDTSGPMGRFTLHLMGALAQLERETISQRIRMGMHQRMADGKYVGGPVPAGLAVSAGRKLVAAPPDSLAVAACWRMVREGRSLLDCARHLVDAGVPGAWTKSRVSALLRCQKYRGVLISAEEQDQALAALGVRPSPGNRRAGRLVSAAPQPTERVWRLHGIAVCRRCGSALVGSHSTGNGGPVAYLRCGGRMRGNGCDAPNLPAEAYEARAVAEVASMLADGPGMIARLEATARLMAQRAEPAAKERPALVLEADRLRTTLERALDLVLQGGPSARAVRQRVADLQGQIEGLESRLAAIDGAISAAGLTSLDAAATIAAIKEHGEGLAGASREDQALAMRRVVRVIRLDVEGIEVEIHPPGMVRTEGAEWLPVADALRTTWTHSASIQRRRVNRGRWELLAG